MKSLKSKAEMSHSEILQLITPEDIGLTKAHKFDEIKNKLNFAIDEGHDVLHHNFIYAAFPYDYFFESNKKATEWLGSASSLCSKIVDQEDYYRALGLYYTENINYAATKYIHIVAQLVLERLIEEIDKRNCK